MITGCFQSVLSLSATMRQSVSFEPPAGKGHDHPHLFLWPDAATASLRDRRRAAQHHCQARRQRILIGIC
jgi:hypothetical protein